MSDLGTRQAGTETPGEMGSLPQAVEPQADGWRSAQARSQLRRGGRFAKAPGKPGAEPGNIRGAKHYGRVILARGVACVREHFPELLPAYTRQHRALLEFMGGDGLIEQNEADRGALVFVARLQSVLDWAQATDPAVRRQAREDMVRILRIEGEAMARVRELAKGRGGKPETLRERMDREQEAMDREIAASRPGAAQSVGRPS